MSKSFPAMAVVGQSAGPARRPGEVLYPILIPVRVLARVPSFCTRPSFENRSLLAFPRRNEYHMAHGAHFLFATRPTVDFHIGNARYGGPFRYLGRRGIFSRQTLRAAGI